MPPNNPMLVDWLFHQIRPADANAVAFIERRGAASRSCWRATCGDGVIDGAVTLATTPNWAASCPSICLRTGLPGMHVQIYRSGVLAVQAVVSDLDSSSVRATVTQVYQTGVRSKPTMWPAPLRKRPAVALRAWDILNSIDARTSGATVTPAVCGARLLVNSGAPSASPRLHGRGNCCGSVAPRRKRRPACYFRYLRVTGATTRQACAGMVMSPGC